MEKKKKASSFLRQDLFAHPTEREKKEEESERVDERRGSEEIKIKEKEEREREAYGRSDRRHSDIFVFYVAFQTGFTFDQYCRSKVFLFTVSISLSRIS